MVTMRNDSSQNGSNIFWTVLGLALVLPLLAKLLTRLASQPILTSAFTKAESSLPAVSKTKDVVSPSAAKETTEEPSTSSNQAPDYPEWTKKELYKLAQELDIHGRSTMNKGELIQAIKKHQGLK